MGFESVWVCQRTCRDDHERFRLDYGTVFSNIGRMYMLCVVHVIVRNAHRCLKEREQGAKKAAEVILATHASRIK